MLFFHALTVALLGALGFVGAEQTQRSLAPPSIPRDRIARNKIIKRMVNGTEESHLLITAVTVDATNTSMSAVQCWELLRPFETSNEPGIIGTMAYSYLASTDPSRYAILPEGFVGTLHPAPFEQFVQIVTGSSHVYVPGVPRTHESEAFIEAGRHGLIIAADTTTIGHVSEYAKDESTVTLQLPIKNGIKGLGGYNVLHSGVCNEYD